MECKSLTRTDVTAVKIIRDEIYVGIGGTLNKYTIKGQLLMTVDIFNGQKIYGIVPNASEQLFIYGGCKMKLLSIRNERNDRSPAIVHNDWILEAKWIDNDVNVALVTMKNIIVVYSASDMRLKCAVSCEEKCILYSAHICYDTWENVIVLCGTVFSEVLILWPAKSKSTTSCRALHRMQGHNGVIFSISYSRDLGIICTNSDDRSVRLWNVKNKDLSFELQRTDVTISERCVMYGHTSRVWTNRILDEYIVTAGEDSYVYVWNLNGTVYRKFETHQGGCIWALDCCLKSNAIVTGGSDCGVAVYSIRQERKTLVLSLNENDVPKSIGILKSCNLAAITEKGLLMYYALAEKQWISVQRHHELISYSLLEMSPCRSLIGLAGFAGHIYIYKEIENSLTNICSYVISDECRIFSFHWLTCKEFLTCGPEGVLSLWIVKSSEKSLKRVAKFFLPPSKERWSTSACYCSDKCIVVGDRKGSVHLFSKDNVEPCQSIWKSHNYLGISKIFYDNNTLISLGRNSTLNEYHFDSENKLFTLLSKDKLPYRWLADLHRNENNTFLIGFSGKNFFIWDHNKRCLLLEFNCGGGHRSWDFYGSAATLNFCYIKDKSMHLHRIDWDCLETTEIIEGFHTKEINSGEIVQLSAQGQYLVLSGSEDTTIRMSCVEFLSNNRTDFFNFKIFKSHLSSIRNISLMEIAPSEDVRNFLMFSSGGRAQLILWNVSIRYSNKKVSNVTSKELDNFYERISNDDAEIRVMSTTSLFFPERNVVALITACSDGNLKFYAILTDPSIENSFKITFVGKLFYKNKCFLNVASVNVLNRSILISMATDGCVVFWNVTKIISAIKSNTFPKKTDENVFSIDPLFSLSAHQSGINGYSTKQIDNETLAILTGGDDNKINFVVIQFSLINDFVDVKVTATYENVGLHCAQITGCYLSEKNFFTTGIDQRLHVFSWVLNESDLTIKRVDSYFTAVADVKGLKCVELGNEQFFVILYGKGIDMCRIKII